MDVWQRRRSTAGEGGGMKLEWYFCIAVRRFDGGLVFCTFFFGERERERRVKGKGVDLLVRWTEVDEERLVWKKPLFFGGEGVLGTEID